MTEWRDVSDKSMQRYGVSKDVGKGEYTKVHTNLRLPPKLRSILEIQAHQNRWTLTDEITQRLVDSFDKPPEYYEEKYAAQFADFQYFQMLKSQEEFENRISEATRIMRNGTIAQKTNYLKWLKIWAGSDDDSEHKVTYTSLIDQFEKDLGL